MSKTLNIGLFGFGVVGEGIYHVLQATPSLHANIQKICIKHADKPRNAPSHLFTTSANELLADDNIQVIVELIDDAAAAFSIVKQALTNKKAVISANKKMIAENLSALLALQTEYNTSFLYEAAVCGAIPVIRNLEEYYDNDLLHSFSGIVNGSTNFILTQMNEEGHSYETALQQAQALGFAESNPDLDVTGKDALNKLLIVLQHAYGLLAPKEDIVHLGITHLQARDVVYSKEKGYKIKLVATAKRINAQEIVAYILPTFVTPDSQLYAIRNEFNGVLIGSKLADAQFLYGKGAGRYPTSSAVLSDISALRYNYRYEYRKTKANFGYQLSQDFLLKIYVSFETEADLQFSDFQEIEERYVSKEGQYLIGTISLQQLQNSTWLYSPKVSVIAYLS
ncbi:MAG: homoserine dehydrogenase [Bacteroidia bacterium]